MSRAGEEQGDRQRHPDRPRDAVARELEILEAVRHPGVVEVVAVDDGPDGPHIRTAPADGVPLSDLGPLTIEEVAGTVAALASTLADLHDLGFVHGSLTAERVLVRSDGGPVLGGFGRGGRTGDLPLDEPDGSPTSSDPAAPDGGPLDPAADVFALGVLLQTLIDRSVAALDGSDGHRSRAVGRATESLRAVADRAVVPERDLRPSTRALAAAVGHAVPGARLPRRSPADDSGEEEEPSVGAHSSGSDGSSPADPLLALRRTGSTPGTPLARLGIRRTARTGGRAPAGRLRRVPGLPVGHPRLVVGAGLVVVTAAAAGLALATGSTTSQSTSTTPTAAPSGTADDRWPPSPAVSPGTAAASTAVTSTPESPVTTTAPPRPAATVPAGRSCTPVAAPLAADTDGDGCLEELRWVDGVVEAADRRWAVGRAGDVVATGNWECEGGARTLALLRPGTGEVFVFDGWADVEEDLVASARTVVGGGFALRSGDLDADGCPELLVDRPGGQPVRVPTAAVP